MLFSSVTFIYFFLPLLLLIYTLTPNKHKNKTILIFSLLFYFIGESKYTIILLASCIINYLLSKKIEKSKKPKIYLIISLTYNIGQLLIFKYTDFFIQNLNSIFNLNINYLYLVMPLGISFFTFQNIGYVIDVYRKKHKSEDNLLEYITYITFFPQLIAGPIVRYSDIKEQLKMRKTSFIKFSEGVKRFTIGLSKKILIANVIGEITKNIITDTLVSSWLNPITFTIQIYFDFSAYSDMAIGLGLMFGFEFLENFNYPLTSTSISDFWRRWHISLSSWFKDYVYIPLGGNKVKKIKWIRNLFVVWLLTGFWHGASWNFIIWGLFFGIILLIEKVYLKKYLDKTKIIKYIYTIFIIIISFQIFKTETFTELITNLKNMFMINDIELVNKEVIFCIRNNAILLIISIIGLTQLPKLIIKKLKETKLYKLINILEPIYYLVLLTLSTAFLIDESFNPFLYFRF